MRQVSSTSNPARKVLWASHFYLIGIETYKVTSLSSIRVSSVKQTVCQTDQISVPGTSLFLTAKEKHKSIYDTVISFDRVRLLSTSESDLYHSTINRMSLQTKNLSHQFGCCFTLVLSELSRSHPLSCGQCKRHISASTPKPSTTMSQSGSLPMRSCSSAKLAQAVWPWLDILPLTLR